MKTLEESIDALMTRYQENVPVRYTEYVEEWNSPIYGTVIDENTVEWTPCRQPEALNFDDLESALEMSFHQSIKTLFGRWYAGDLALDYQGTQLVCYRRRVQKTVNVYQRILLVTF